jgi:hypothetical protein
MQNDTQQLLTERGTEYGNTWYLAGKIMKELQLYNYPLFVKTEYGHNWVLMLSKLLRMLFSPYKADNYRDIIGYATLVLEDIERNKNDC